jgi:hypothetical protein
VVIGFDGGNKFINGLLVLKGGYTAPKWRRFLLTLRADCSQVFTVASKGQSTAGTLSCKPGKCADAIITKTVVFEA